MADGIFKYAEFFYGDRIQTDKIVQSRTGKYETPAQPWYSGVIISFDDRTERFSKRELYSITKSSDWNERKIIREIDISFTPYYDENVYGKTASYSLLRVKKSIFDKAGFGDPAKVKNSDYVVPDHQQLITDPTKNFMRSSTTCNNLNYDPSAEDDLILLFDVSCSEIMCRISNKSGLHV